MKKILIINDEEIRLNKHSSNEIYYNWNGDDKLSSSLSNYIKKNKNYLKQDYLDFVENIKTSQKNKLLSEVLNFKIYNRYNIFEISNIYEKNIFKSNKIIDCIKLLAIRKIIKEKKISEIHYYGKEIDIFNSLKIICDNCNLIFVSFNQIKLKKKYFLKTFYIIKSIIFYLIYIIKRFNILILKSNLLKFQKNNIFLFSYYVHLKSNKISNLWGNLTETLIKNKYKINWLHDFSPSNQVPNSKIFLKNINSLNNNNNNHIPLDSYLNFNSIIKIFMNFFKIVFKYLFIDIKNIFYYKKKKINFNYFLNDNLIKSVFGPDLIKNLIYIEIFENLFSKSSKIKIGLYLLENQAWESIMIKAWKYYKHGTIIGSINSTVRDWDLRYFKPNNYKKNNSYYPDFIAVNGELNKKLISKNKFINSKKIIPVEAVRYNYLQNIVTRKKIYRSVIIFGDISIKINYEILNDLEKSLKQIKKKYIFYFKPHPTLPKKIVDNLFKRFNFLKNINNFNINYNQFEYCICSETTSAVIEAIYFRLKTIIYVSKNSINLSPLPPKLWKNYGYSDKDFVNFFQNSSKNKKIMINRLIDINSKNNKWLKFLKKNL